MATITLETIAGKRLDNGREFELIRVQSLGAHIGGEVRETIIAQDRMIAAMINLGRACKWFTENNSGRRGGYIHLQKDETNPNELNGGEHNELVAAVSDLREYRKDRLKYEALYGNYVRYLDKIVWYLREWQLSVKLTDYKQTLWQ